jgi:HK97 family phage major capsid protein
MECKFKEIESIEGLMQKSSAELYGCGCERCQPVAEKKELAELRAEKQTQMAQEAVRKEEMEKIKQLENAVKGFEDLLESVRMEEREKLMKEKGLDKKGFLNNPMFHQWMNNNFVAPKPKSVYANTKFGREQLSPEMKNFIHYCKTGEFLYKDLTSNPESNGAGSFVPEEFYNQVIKERDRMSVLRQIGAQVIPMDSDSVKVPVEANPEGAYGNGQFRDQNTAMEDNSPTLDDITLSPKDWTDMVKVHRSMLADSGVPLADYLSRLFGRRLAKFENDKLINGAGGSDVEGLDYATARMVDAALTTVTSASETIRKLFFSLAKEYRNNAVWLMNSGKLSQLVQHLNNGNLSWMVSYRDGVPAALLGRPVYEIEDIADEDTGTDGAAGESKIFFGDPSYILVGERAGLSVLRSTERYFEQRKVAFAAERRFDLKFGVPSGATFQPFAYGHSTVITGA